MRPLTAATEAALVELHRLVGERSWRRERAHLDAILAEVQRVAAAGEPRAIPHLVPLVGDPRPALAEAAGRAAAALWRRIPVRDLVAADRALRDSAFYGPHVVPGWHMLTSGDVATLAAQPAGPTLVQIAMCHPSGRVREQAIRTVATHADGAEVFVLLLRTNDWVAPVRDLAVAAVRIRLTVAHAPDLVAALPLLDAMRGWGRLGGARVLDACEEVLAAPAAVPALMAAVTSPERLVRRGAYRRLFAAPSLAVVETALRDVDPAIRSWAGRWLTTAPADTFTVHAPALLRSRAGAVRLGAAHRLRTLGRAVPWEPLLVDPHPGVRALAQQAVLDGERDPADLYRARLASTTGARLGLALLGLGETGGPADVALVEAHRADGSPVVRASALRALASLAVDDLVPRALAALADPSPTVTRAARDLLLARRTDVRAADVWAAMSSTVSPAGQRAALAVLAKLGLWPCLPYLVRAFTAGDAAMQARVLLHLARWLTRRKRTFVRPSADVARDSREVIRAAGLPAALGVELLRVIEA